MHKSGITTEDRRTTAETYLSSKRIITNVAWPGGTKEVGMLYLTCGEQQDAFFAARDWFDANQQPVDDAAALQLNLEHSYQVVMRMLVDPSRKDPTAKVFNSVDDIRKRLTPNQVEYFIAKHRDQQSTEAADIDLDYLDPHLRAIGDLMGFDDEATGEDIAMGVAALKAAAA